MDRLLQKDMVVRIISVLLAVVIWASVSSDQNAPKARHLEVPLTQVGLNAGLRVTAIPLTIGVDLQGSPDKLDRLQPADVKALADLSGFREPGTYEVPITVSPPTGSQITVVSEPGHISVTIEALATVKRRPEISPVQPVLDGDRRIAVTQPDQDVTVSGLATLMARVDRVAGEIPLPTIDKSGDRTVALKAVDDAGNEIKGLSLVPDQVTVSVSVTPLPPGKLLPVRAQFQGGPPEGFTVAAEVSPRVVRVRGSADLAAGWSDIVTEPIPLAGHTESFTVEARLIRPPGAQYMDQDTVTVNVTLAEVGDSKVLKNVPLKVANLAANQVATVSVTEVQVTLRGPKRAVAALDPTKVEAYLDVENLTPGEHRLKVMVQGAPGLEPVVNPDVVSVVLAEKPKSP